MRPVARKDKLTIRELPEETLVYDLERHRMHCLNRTAALVWKHCDGRHDLAALAALLAGTLGLPAEEAEAAARLALEQLGRRNLLQEAIATPTAEEHVSRRSALRRMAVAAAALLPVVMSLCSPSRAYGVVNTGCQKDADCPTGQICKLEPSSSGPHNSGTTGTCVAVQTTNTGGAPKAGAACTVQCTYSASAFLVSSSFITACATGTCSVSCPSTGTANSTQTFSGTCQ